MWKPFTARLRRVYEVETFSSREDFLAKATTYAFWFNSARKNSYKNHQTPWQIVQAREPSLQPEIVAFPPLFLDELFNKTLQDKPGGGYNVIPYPSSRFPPLVSLCPLLNKLVQRHMK